MDEQTVLRFLTDCGTKSVESIREYINAGADVNVTSSIDLELKTPLFAAARNNNHEVFKFLLDNGAKFTTDCLRVASVNGDLEIIKTSTPYFKQWSINYIIRGIVESGQTDILDYILSVCDFNEYYQSYLDAFFYACRENQIGIIESIINFVDSNNKNYMEGFFENGFMIGIQAQLDFNILMKIFIKCNPSYKNMYGFGFIDKAIHSKNHAMIEFLLDYNDASKTLITICSNMNSPFPLTLFNKILSKANIDVTNPEDRTVKFYLTHYKSCLDKYLVP